MRERFDIARDERGATMVEVLVSTATGLVVLSALTMVIVVSMHANARVSARADATQRARLVATKIMQQLHSACVAPKIAPIQPGSTGTSLNFVYAPPSQGSAVAPMPTMTQISYSSGTLTQTSWPATGGGYPNWTYSSTPVTQTLLTGVAPIPPSTTLFSYFASSNGSTNPTPQTTPLQAADTSLTIQVRLALTAQPAWSKSPVADQGAEAHVRTGATLRLTPPSFNDAAPALPCQ
jgi:Flp pilus assembly pilin Flp